LEGQNPRHHQEVGVGSGGEGYYQKWGEADNSGVQGRNAKAQGKDIDLIFTPPGWDRLRGTDTENM